MVGRYWARWGDALVEAGFEPNEMQDSYPTEYLITSLVSLIRESGRFPTDAELRMRRRADSSFPSHNAFGRLGKRVERAGHVLRYCEGQEELDDVRAICAPLASTPDKAEATTDSPEHAGVIPGDVYLMRSGLHYKLGRSNSAGRRA
jgi:hypothetical protein